MLSFNCATGAIVFGTVGSDPGKRVEYQAAGVTTWSTNPNQRIDAGLLRDVGSRRILVVQGRYFGEPTSEVSYYFDFRAPCGQARLGVEASEPLSVRVLGNPSTSGNVTVEVSGASGQSLQLWINNAQGQRISQPSVGIADAVEHRTLQMGQQPGVYFLQVVTPTESKTMKLVRH